MSDRTRFPVVAAFLAASLLPLAPSARAAGTIRKLVVSPSPATAGQEVTVRLEGSGSCTAWIDFGDQKTLRGPVTLPADLKHTYAAHGTYLIKVLPPYRSGSEPAQLSGCGGFDDLLLKVNAARATAANLKAAPLSKTIPLADGRVFVLDPVTGQVRFGDGVQGKSPPAGTAVPDGTYRTGAGAAGNVIQVRGGKIASGLPTPTPSTR